MIENYMIPENLTVYCVTAETFPEGALKAHKQLHAKVPLSYERKYFGISRWENRTMIYKAGATALSPGELDALGLEKVVLPKGDYLSIIVKDFMSDVSAIGRAFEQLTSLPDVDPEGYGLEWYFNDGDVQCMMRKKDQL
ncbi:transcriptional regulator [Pedobacter deserti]|uniref:transcriptional regulator n=1 Tax=Pedobacter deserti TaxID=2817382 RepID=UPI00210AEBB7|nr:transcriptional regulator [Pedobacter sp. SYSU D00382]